MPIKNEGEITITLDVLLIDSTISLLDTYLLYRFMRLFVQERESIRHRKIPVFLGVLAVHLGAVYLFGNALFLSSLKIGAFIAIDFLACWVLFKDRHIKRVAAQAGSSIMVMAADILSIALHTMAQPGGLLFRLTDARQYDLESFLWIMALRGITALLICGLQYIKSREATKDIWRGLLAMPVLSILLAVAAFPHFWSMGDARINSFIMIVGVFLAIQNVMLLGYMAVVQGSVERQARTQAEVRDRDHAIEIAQREREAVRGERHDMQNRLTPAIEMLAKGDAEGAYRHLLEIAGRLDDAASTIITGNLCVDGILNDKIQRGEDKGVRVAVTGQLDADLPVSPVDMGSLLGNALDNAIEACPAGGEVSVSFDCHGDMLVLEVRNPYRGKRKQGGAGRFTTTKLGDHGYGMNSMCEVAARHNGSLIAWIEDEQFILNATLQIKAAMVLG